MERQLKKRRILPVAIALVAIVALSGVAYAWWSSNGVGSGTGSTTAGETNILSASGNVLNAMYPGDSPQDIVITVTNTSGTQSAYATQVVVAVGDSTPTGCGAANFTVVGATVAVGRDIAHGGSVVLTVANGFVPPTIQFNNLGSNQNVCKNVTVNLTYTIS